MNAASGPRWTGEMLDSPEKMDAYTAQLRAHLAHYVTSVADVYRDADAMWKANPPAEYGACAAWWNHRQVTGPFAAILKHLEEAMRLTFKVEAEYRRRFHETPEAMRREAAAKRQQAAIAGGPPPALGSGNYGGRNQQPAQRPPGGQPAPGASFMDLVQEQP